MRSDLNRYEMDYTDKKENKIASLLIAFAYLIAIGGTLYALYALSGNAYSAFWTTLFLSVATGLFFRGMAEIILLLQAILHRPKG